jgi:hypothetical protein
MPDILSFMYSDLAEPKMQPRVQGVSWFTIVLRRRIYEHLAKTQAHRGTVVFDCPSRMSQ